LALLEEEEERGDDEDDGAEENKENRGPHATVHICFLQLISHLVEAKHESIEECGGLSREQCSLHVSDANICVGSGCQHVD